MSRALLTLNAPSDRLRASRWLQQAPAGTRLEFKAPQRSLEQNSRMWAMLTDVSTQKMHAGRRYTPDQWKVLFMHACGREIQFLPALDNSTFIPWGQSSSDLSTSEMADLITFMMKWGDENGVRWTDPAAPALAPA
jgi:hypothetical protein